MNARQQGLYQKFYVCRTDGRDAPGEKHHGAEYFVLDISDDPYAIPAMAAYAKACRTEYPTLAADLASKVAAASLASSKFITVPETTLPSGLVVPAFQVAKYLMSRDDNGQPVSVANLPPWVEINYHDAKATAESAGLKLLTDTQALAIAWNASQQDINWSGGAVGEGKLFQGLHKDTLDGAQPATFESDDPEERRWLQLSNGERIYDIAGNAFSWIFDDIQGNDAGLTTIIKADSPSLTTAPYPSRENGMGWRPDGERDWSGNALVRGGYWSSESNAGAFYLYYGWPVYADGGVGFRCTKPGL